MEIADIFKYSQSDWVKYSDYEYKASPNGELYIMPTKNATVNVYNPLQEMDKLLIDTLNIGRLAAADEPEMPKVKSEILTYVKRYGLLGFMISFPLSMDFLEKNYVLLGDNPLTNEQTMKTKDYLKLFIPFKIEQSENDSNLPAAMFMSRPPVYEIAFGRGYGEKFEWICGLFSKMFIHFAAAFYYDKTEDIAVKSMYAGIVDAFKMYGLGFRVKMMGAPTLLWDFSSLKTAIDTLYGFYLTDPDRPLRICKHCRKVFVTRNTRGEFCSIPCRNQFNVYKSRGKK